MNPRVRQGIGLSLVSGLLLVSFADAPDRASALSSVKPTRSCPGGDARPLTATLGQARAAVLCLLNAERAARGLTALALEPRLQAAAERHSRDMAERDFFDHVTPGGTGYPERVRAAGFPTSGVNLAENLAWGTGAFGQPRSVVETWMSSPPHRATILNPAMRQVGIGIALGVPEPDVSGGATYTADFAGASSRRPPARLRSTRRAR
jgi:uncharacterized protein YkwD